MLKCVYTVQTTGKVTNTRVSRGMHTRVAGTSLASVKRWRASRSWSTRECMPSRVIFASTITRVI